MTERHDQAVRETVQKLRGQGYRVVEMPSYPDAIAVKEGKIYAVEILKSNGRNNVMSLLRQKEYRGYDDIILQFFNEGGLLNNHFFAQEKLLGWEVSVSSRKEITSLRKEDWQRLYVQERKSIVQIAKEIHASTSTVRLHLKALQIPLRSRKEDGKNYYRSLRKEGWERLYIQERKSTVQIAKKLGIHASTVQRHLKALQIPRRSLKEADKNYRYKS